MAIPTCIHGRVGGVRLPLHLVSHQTACCRSPVETFVGVASPRFRTAHPSRDLGQSAREIDEPLEGLQVAPRSGGLHRSGNRSGHTCDCISGSREGADREPDYVVILDGDYEQLLPLLGMARERPVGKSPAIRFIDDAHDPAGSSDGDPGRPKGYHYGRPWLDCRGVRKDIDPRNIVTLPCLQARRCPSEGRPPDAHFCSVGVVAVSLWTLTTQSRAHLGVRGLGVRRSGEQSVHRLDVTRPYQLHDRCYHGLHVQWDVPPSRRSGACPDHAPFETTRLTDVPGPTLVPGAGS